MVHGGELFLRPSLPVNPQQSELLIVWFLEWATKVQIEMSPIEATKEASHASL